MNDLDSLAEPVFPPVGWMDDSPTGTLADHPLLRGLLLELPPKGTVPAPGWLDRWFEAARSILELLYVQSAGAAAAADHGSAGTLLGVPGVRTQD